MTGGWDDDDDAYTGEPVVGDGRAVAGPGWPARVPEVSAVPVLVAAAGGAVAATAVGLLVLLLGGVLLAAVVGGLVLLGAGALAAAQLRGGGLRGGGLW